MQGENEQVEHYYLTPVTEKSFGVIGGSAMKASLLIYLDEFSFLAERSQYTILELISDIGGFWSAIVFIPEVFAIQYASRILFKSMAQDVTVQRKGFRKTRIS